ncbi:MAG: DNA-binding protein [Syntrophaceae bacterium]|nr:DNA-binding protein [Syntrophaceae bacterium]
MKSKQEKKRTLTPQQVEAIYGIPVGTLANMRCQKRGPKYYVLNSRTGKKRRVLYFVEDVETWIKINPVITIDSLTVN